MTAQLHIDGETDQEGGNPGTADFWQSSGYRLLEPRGGGRLGVTDDFFRAYLARPELRPVAESCAAEIELHRALMVAPRTPVEPERLAGLADATARDNYGVFLGFRDLLLAHDSLEASYLGLLRDGATGFAPLFLDQMVHAILRGALAECRDTFRLRAAELLFRTQTVSIEDGGVMLADEETVEMRAAQAQRPRELMQPVAGTPAQVELDVLSEANASAYWSRSDRFDMALNAGFTQPGLDALCRVLEIWVEHFLAVPVSVQPVQQIRDERWVWHVGLDAEASAILNDLYRGETVADPAIARLLSLFRLEFRNPADMREDVAGRPVYLAMAMNEANRLRLKPQNLLVHLPLKAPA
ncbi:MAG: DUF6352 family protein [Geminicoccaceae bacterium]